MDQSVIDAIARWPNVPAVYGWLSLNCRGLWRLHPLGDATRGGAGESVTNTQILGFIDRNYLCDARGAWYFQNGPQRVYVRLDGAPFILRLGPAEGALTTHTQHTVTRVDAWFVDEAGNLFASTDLGPGRIDDRDLPGLADLLTDANGRTMLQILEDLGPDTIVDASIRLRASDNRHPAMLQEAPLYRCAQADIPSRLGFVANPTGSND